MKRILRMLLLLSLVFCTMQLEARDPLGLSLKAGLNLSDYYSSQIDDSSIKIGYNVGIAVDYQLGRNFYLLSGIELSSKGTKVKGEARSIGQLGGSESNMGFKQTWNTLYLQVPLHVGYVVKTAEGMNFLFHIGPYVACGVGGSVKSQSEGLIEELSLDNKTDAFGKDGSLRRWDIGLGLGVGFEVKGIGINLGYDLGFLRGNKYYKMKNNVASISLAYRFY